MMISDDFRKTLDTKNILRTKIMLKDSLTLDSSFRLFNEMLETAKSYFPNLIEVHNGDFIEYDERKWNRELMDMELVKLVNNFSRERIDFVQKLIKTFIPSHENNLSKNNSSNIFKSNLLPVNTISDILIENARISKIVSDIIRKMHYEQDDINKLELCIKKMSQQLSSLKGEKNGNFTRI